MKLKRRAREDVEINVGPFSDIAFLLIIFFILTTTFIKPAGSKLDLPSGTAKSGEQNEKQFTVNLKQDEIRYGEKSKIVSIEQLRDILQNENFPLKPPDKRIVILDSAKDVTYERYFQVIMSVTNAGGVVALIEDE